MSALGELFAEHGDLVYRTALRLTGSRGRRRGRDAGAVRATARAPCGDSPELPQTFAAWIRRVAVRQALMQLRGGRRRREVGVDGVVVAHGRSRARRWSGCRSTPRSNDSPTSTAPSSSSRKSKATTTPRSPSCSASPPPTPKSDFTERGASCANCCEVRDETHPDERPSPHVRRTLGVRRSARARGGAFARGTPRRAVRATAARSSTRFARLGDEAGRERSRVRPRGCGLASRAAAVVAEQERNTARRRRRPRRRCVEPAPALRPTRHWPIPARNPVVSAWDY